MTRVSPTVASLEENAFALAQAALREQERGISELRSRTGTLLTAASLVASFLGAQAIRQAGFDAAVVLALLAFGATIVLSVYVLLPKDGLIFSLNGPEAYEALFEIRDDENEVYRRLAYWIQSFRHGNQATVDSLTLWFRGACGALLLEIALLAVALAVH
jgi:hypothetical protein